MKILNVRQVQETDAYTIQHEPIASIDLMERASLRFVEAFVEHHHKSEHIAVVCGPGNNGGDGLAVYRLLSEMGYEVVPIIIQPKDGGSKDFLINLTRLDSKNLQVIRQSNDIPDFSSYETIIDAIFGSGLTRPVDGLFAEVINSINKNVGKVIAIDMPSGLYMDEPAPDGAIIEAVRTISFQTPKLAFFFPENHRFVGDWQIVDIGLSKEFIAEQKTGYAALDEEMVSHYLPVRNKFAHKGSFGHVQLFGGSYGKIGAMVLAAEAALRSGAGLVSTGIPRCGHSIMQTSLPEIMLSEESGENEITDFKTLEKAEAIGVGPGLGTARATLDSFGEFLRQNNKPLVIDADGLNFVAERADFLALLPEDTILTPHLKEFDRLAGDSLNNWQRLEKARSLAQLHKLHIVLKGAHTAIIESDGSVTFNTTGNHGMATGGSGDVLLGLITGLRAQGLAANSAAKLGVYLHGLAGDLATRNSSKRSLIAGDIVASLGEAFLSLER